MAITKAQFKKIALSFPEANEKLSYGSPAIFIAKKFFTRLRSQDDSIVWIVGSIDERDHMLEMDPKTYFITDHYKKFPYLLARLSKLDKTTLKELLSARLLQIEAKTRKKRTAPVKKVLAKKKRT